MYYVLLLINKVTERRCSYRVTKLLKFMNEIILSYHSTVNKLLQLMQYH